MAKPKNPFVLDCPICHEPAIPRRTDLNVSVPDYRMVHANRIATCFVRGDSDAAQIIRTRFDEWFGTNDTSIATQTCTGRISNDSIDAERGETFIRSKDPFITVDEALEAMERRLIIRSGIDTWEGEGGYCPAHKD